MQKMKCSEECPKCRTTNFANCHSMYCPMRKQNNVIEGSEDVERRQRHSVAKRILSDGDEEYKLNCICTLLESQSENSRLQQLIKEEKEVSKERLKGWIEATKELKSAQELNRELVEWIEGHVDLEELADPKRIELLVQKAKNLSA